MISSNLVLRKGLNFCEKEISLQIYKSAKTNNKYQQKKCRICFYNVLKQLDRDYVRIFLSACMHNFIYKMKRWKGIKSIHFFVKWVIQNNLDALAAINLKWKNEKNSTWVNFNAFTLIKCNFSIGVIFRLLFKKCIPIPIDDALLFKMLKYFFLIWSCKKYLFSKNRIRI